MGGLGGEGGSGLTDVKNVLLVSNLEIWAHLVSEGTTYHPSISSQLIIPFASTKSCAYVYYVNRFFCHLLANEKVTSSCASTWFSGVFVQFRTSSPGYCSHRTIISLLRFIFVARNEMPHGCQIFSRIFVGPLKSNRDVDTHHHAAPVGSGQDWIINHLLLFFKGWMTIKKCFKLLVVDIDFVERKIIRHLILEMVGWIWGFHHARLLRREVVPCGRYNLKKDEWTKAIIWKGEKKGWFKVQTTHGACCMRCILLGFNGRCAGSWWIGRKHGRNDNIQLNHKPSQNKKNKIKTCLRPQVVNSCNFYIKFLHFFSPCSYQKLPWFTSHKLPASKPSWRPRGLEPRGQSSDSKDDIHFSPGKMTSIGKPPPEKWEGGCVWWIFHLGGISKGSRVNVAIFGFVCKI